VIVPHTSHAGASVCISFIAATSVSVVVALALPDADRGGFEGDLSA